MDVKPEDMEGQLYLYLLKKKSWVKGPMQFYSVLFKGQLDLLVGFLFYTEAVHEQELKP